MNTAEIADLKIRRANKDDAAEIANVHLNSWREAYEGILAKDFLDDLPMTFKRRMQMWKQVTDDERKIVFVAEGKMGIVGFSLFEAARDISMPGYIEIGAIYLLEKFKGKGVGATLLSLGMQESVKKGFSKAYCWVIDKNPTIEFYERSGAAFNGMKKSVEIGGKAIEELVFEWQNLEKFKTV